MTVTIRQYLLDLPSYRPGRRPGQTANPGAVKLSSNESPFPLLPGVAESVAAELAQSNRYPDANASSLREVIAGQLGVDAACVVAAGGSVTIISPLLQCVVAPGDEVVYAWRTFEACVTATAVLGGKGVAVPLRDWRHDLESMADAVTERTRAIVVCNPNNPTGTVVHTEEMRRLLERVPSETLVVLDEAYWDFVADGEVPDGTELFREGYDNLAILRTFSKARGLAGLRIGYCVTSEPLAEVLRRLIPVFSISRVAEAAAVAAMSPQATTEMDRRVKVILAERERLSARLRELGFDVPKSEGNFVWIPLGEASSEFAEKLEAEGVIARSFPPDGVRVTVGLPDENDAFLRAATPLLRAIV
ncbi:MAG: histidinol-phosphate transaminase [Acidimicrobiales bacterium]